MSEANATTWAETTFLVLGAHGGIGAALSRALRDRGTRVIAAGRDETRLAALADEIGATAVPCDATDFDAVERAVERAREVGDGRLEGIASCVGSMVLKPASQTSFEVWHETIEKNLTSAFALVRAASRSLRDGGSVVLFSSSAAAVGIAHHEAIAAAKAGVEGLVRAAAASAAARGLRFNAVAPGLVRTPVSATRTANERALEASRQMHPLRRIGEPDDVVSAALWLLDPRNSWVTGHVLRVDGGLAPVRPPVRA